MLGLVDVQRSHGASTVMVHELLVNLPMSQRPPEPERGAAPNQLVTKNLFPMDMATVYMFFFCVYTTCSTHGNIPWIKWLYAFISQSLWDLYKHKTINHSSNIPYLTCSTTSNWFPPKKNTSPFGSSSHFKGCKNHTFSTYNGSSSSPLYISITFYYVTFQIYGDNDVPMLSPWYTYIYIYTYVHIYYIPMISPCNHHHMESISIARPWPDRPLLVPGWQHLDLTFGHSIPRLPSVQFRRLFCDSCRVL